MQCSFFSMIDKNIFRKPSKQPWWPLPLGYAIRVQFHAINCTFLKYSTFWILKISSIFSSVQLLSHVWLFVNPWISACQASLSIINSWSLLKFMSIKSGMPSSHLILCRPLLLLPPIPPSIRVFSNESTLCMRWSKYWSFSFSISPSNEHPGQIL